MASLADIWNTALAHVGAAGRVVDPTTPDGTREAELCRTFYPIARRHLLESSNAWQFATKRVTLAAVPNTNTEWQYAYGLPSDFVRLVRVMSPHVVTAVYQGSEVPLVSGAVMGHPYAVELVGGVPVLYTNVPDAVLVYIADAVDPGRFSSLFTTVLGYTLAAFIAGALVKGTAGARLAMELRKTASELTAEAEVAQANAAQPPPLPKTPSLAARS